MVQDPSERTQWLLGVPYLYRAAFILFYAHGGSGGVSPVLKGLVMVDDIVYSGLSPVGNLKTTTPAG